MSDVVDIEGVINFCYNDMEFIMECFEDFLSTAERCRYDMSAGISERNLERIFLASVLMRDFLCYVCCKRLGDVNLEIERNARLGRSEECIDHDVILRKLENLVEVYRVRVEEVRAAVLRWMPVTPPLTPFDTPRSNSNRALM